MKNLTQSYLADLQVGNVLLHNLHWNVQGLAFKQVHEMLEGLYDDAFEKFDEVAERMKMDGDRPMAQMKEYLEAADVKDIENKDYSIPEALEEAQNYLEKMKEKALKIREEADKKGAFPWVNMMEDHLAGYDKSLWFLKQTLVK